MSANVSFQSDLAFFLHCAMVPPSSSVYISIIITSILLLLPLCILVVRLGFLRWRRRRRRCPSAATTTTHSDSFTYHLVAMELIGNVGQAVALCGIFVGRAYVIQAGMSQWSFSWYGEFFFHLLTCAERYLAVVHPVTYVSLRGERGIRMRKVTIGCVWLLCLLTAVLMFFTRAFFIMDGFILCVSFVVTSFCSVSVLCVLIRPGPGDQAGGGDRVDQSKKRAFYTILVIFAVLMLKIFWCLICIATYVLKAKNECVWMVSGNWFSLPSSLILPVLTLHRAGTFARRKKK